jgi:phosphatidate cytidylyltransferase
MTTPSSSRSERRAAAEASRTKPSRAGRNLPVATLVGVSLGVVILASLVFRKEAFIALVTVAACLAVWELRNGLAQGQIHIPMVPCLIGTITMITASFRGGGQALTVSFGLTCISVLIWRALDGLQNAVRDIAGGIFVVAYVPLLASFSSLLLAAPDGVQRVVVFIIVTVCSDLGGYAVGVVAGRHPMAPSVSPKKSWEGAAGSALACVIGGVATVMVLLGGPWWAGAALGLALVASATVGDLTESTIKRDLGIKDMGSILPGHGGLMDRLDSLLLSAPVAWALLAVLVPFEIFPVA